MPGSVPPLLPITRTGLGFPDELGRLRDERPIARFSVLGTENAWLASGYHEVRAVLGDPDGYSNDVRLAGDIAGRDVLARWNPGGLGFHDPPVHTRLRRLLAPAFTARAVHRLTRRIEAIVAEQLDALERSGSPVDLVGGFAVPVASRVICELIGASHAELAQIGNGRFGFAGGLDATVAAIGESLPRVLELVARQRIRPGSGLLGRLIREHGEHLDDRELAGLMDGLLTGGQETTASMIALGGLVLLRDPRLAGLVAAGGGPVGPVVDELLRQVSVAQIVFPRFARHAIVLRGHQLAAGDMVICSVPAANHDPLRGAAPHLAFGHGIHRCLGAALARLELCVAYTSLLRRFPGLRLAVPEENIVFTRFSVVHGVESLPVAW